MKHLLTTLLTMSCLAAINIGIVWADTANDVGATSVGKVHGKPARPNDDADAETDMSHSVNRQPQENPFAAAIRSASKSAKKRRVTSFGPATAAELRQVQALFTRTFRLAAVSAVGNMTGDAEIGSDGADVASALPSRSPDGFSYQPEFDALVAEWKAVQMTLTRWRRFLTEDGRKIEVWILREFKSRKEGRGFYAFVPSPVHPHIVQAPHSFHDVHTREIATALFRSGQFAAAGWNTVSRNSVDLAHTRFHYINAFTEAAQDSHPAARTIQLHGFSAVKRATAAGMSADVILSNGTERPSRALIDLQRILDSGWKNYEVCLYPVDVRELGATRNAQAKLLHADGPGRFVHLEMSRPLRVSIASDAAVRAELLEALMAACRR